MQAHNWYEVENIDECHTPNLLVFPERIKHNIGEMIRIAGGAERLRPHVKTYKMAEVIQMQLDHGITSFKCATIAEAELLAKTGAKDILLAMQPVGPNISRFLQLITEYPKLEFSCLVDNMMSLQAIAKEAEKKKIHLGIFIDINNGMNRTGIVPGKTAVDLFLAGVRAPFLKPRSFHVYDGHLRIPDVEERKKACAAALQPVLELKRALVSQGKNVEPIVAGGSPTFPVHAYREDVILSPGTVLLWDAGYGSKFPEMNFQYAAILVTRLISKPEQDQICLDLGHKSLASEMPFPRVRFLDSNDFEQMGQSEEHFVITSKSSKHYAIGDLFYAVPMHVCPTVAKYPEVQVVENKRLSGTWKVAARDHKMSF